jgi:hypothetical protein
MALGYSQRKCSIILFLYQDMDSGLLMHGKSVQAKHNSPKAHLITYARSPPSFKHQSTETLPSINISWLTLFNTPISIPSIYLTWFCIFTLLRCRHVTSRRAVPGQAGIVTQKFHLEIALGLPISFQYITNTSSSNVSARERPSKLRKLNRLGR